MASLERNHTSQEPTTPVDDDSFATAVHTAADLLESPLVRPDAESFEVLRTPFGRLGDGGTLAADMTWSNGLSGRIIYAPYDRSDKGRIHVNKHASEPHWNWLNYAGRVSNEELVNRLKADWPAGNDLTNDLADKEGYELYAGLQGSLLSLTPPHWQTERSYRYNEMGIDPAGQLHHDDTTALTVHTYQDGMRRLQVTATQRVDKNGDPLRCRATIDELGMVELRAYLHDLSVDRITEVPIADKQRALGSLTILLDRLVAEKYPLAQ